MVWGLTVKTQTNQNKAEGGPAGRSWQAEPSLWSSQEGAS